MYAVCFVMDSFPCLCVLCLFFVNLCMVSGSYVVSIHTENTPGVSSDRIVQMRGVNGMLFNCTVPLPPSSTQKTDTNTLDVSIEYVEVEKDEEERIERKRKMIAAKIQKITTPVSLKAGYWTYRLYPFKYAIQYHEVTHGNGRDPSFRLGNYRATPPLYSAFNLTAFRKLHEGKSKDDDALINYLDSESSDADYMQYFDGGTDGRNLTVYYVCKSSLAKEENQHVIARMHEPKAFNYIFVVHTTAACLQQNVVKGNSIINASKSVQSYLQALSGKCTQMNVGWWSYELCFQKSMRQYHFDSEKGTITSEFVLGKFNLKDHPPTFVAASKSSRIPTVSMLTVESAINGVLGEKTKQSYISATYVNGTSCDIEAIKRSVEIRIYCDSSLALGQTRLETVEEVASCTYRASVFTGALCAHEAFKAETEQISEIVCSPI